VSKSYFSGFKMWKFVKNIRTLMEYGKMVALKVQGGAYFGVR
jgi:hypothetical protein